MIFILTKVVGGGVFKEGGMKPFVLILSLFVTLGLLSPSLASAKSMPPENLPLLEMVGKTYYLGTNLHADLTFNKISSVNYQSGGLLSWGRKVRIERILRNRMIFVDTESGRRYSYEFHRNTRSATSLKKHVQRVFLSETGYRELEGRVNSLPDIDKDGIYEGRVLPGMSRQGVIIAAGYPPEFANPGDIMTARSWHYWQGRWDKIVIHFDRRGNVARIED